MKTIKNILLILLFSACRQTNQQDYYSETINTAQKVDGKMTVITQIIYTYRKSDSLLIAQLTKLYNYNDDYNTSLTHGIKKTDGLQDCYVDSTFYDSAGNDTLRIVSSCWKNIWERTQTLTKKFNNRNQVVFIETVQPKNSKFTEQIFYKYNNKNQLYMETVYECSEQRPCDSLKKTIYHYNINGKQDSISLYTWKEKQWDIVEKKPATNTR